jgi:metal-dependent HD superfamily phosphatase/phosphodiesterase
VVDRVNRDDSIKALWHAANVNAVARMQINDHSWVHIQIVTNIGLKLLRELKRAGIEPGMVTDYSMRQEDAEVVVALGCLTHCLGMAIHRHGHEEMSLFLAADRLPGLLEGLYEEPERTIVVAEVLQTIISHRSDGQPLSLEAGIVRVADALDMAKGRSRIPFETGRVSIHSLSAAAIEEVVIRGGKDGKVLVEIEMNNSAGLFQVDNLLRSKLRGSGLEDYIEVAATLEGETEKRLLPSFRL